MLVLIKLASSFLEQHDLHVRDQGHKRKEKVKSTDVKTILVVGSYPRVYKSGGYTIGGAQRIEHYLFFYIIFLCWFWADRD